MEELNSYVGDSVQGILDDEKQFFESDTKDKLKVPPFTKVKRIPRDYMNEQKISEAYKKQNAVSARNDEGFGGIRDSVKTCDLDTPPRPRSNSRAADLPANLRK